MDEQTHTASDPYAPPVAPVAEPQDAAGLPLFKIAGIGIATFFGSVLAGGLLMAMNFHRMGRPDRVWPTLGLALLGLVATGALGAVLPEQFPGMLITVPTLVAVTMLAGRTQGEAIARRERAGLPMRSNWLAFGISLLVLLPIVALGVGLLLLASG
ncbi:hypothetical protein [Luteimonas sp. FCS-9]|uniref:hypothetical protein n=1 Tax=Luteimonas sp. FCS-9 TaxID=1547516 RepID=UPI00063EB264|nr:hypothetical protein [Luteimonas sp. FCS-9]KLJ02319.1 hypothetical protein WQ56_01815 [Luteimonas sp. FCS-9]